MERGQIVALATVVIPPDNTPQKKRGEYLISHPRWKYIGPADTIRFEWQIGKWGWAGFAGETARKYSTHSQPASMELAEFSISLPSISLSPLSPSDEPYDCEIWFKDKFSDLRVIVENCVRIVEEVGYTLTVRVAYPAVGWVSKSPDKPTYALGEVVTVTAHLDAWAIGSYTFDYWDVDGELYDAPNPMDFYVLASRTVTAHFREI